MTSRDELVASIVKEVLLRLQPPAGAAAVKASVPARRGVFADVNSAVDAASAIQPRVAALSLEERGTIVDVIRGMCSQNADEWARMELEETGIGRLEHKIEKLKLIRRVLGVEALRTEVRTDVSGLCVIENAPFGVIAMALPATHSVPTLASNAINVIAAGNTPVFSPHPAASKIAAHAVGLMNGEVEKRTGLPNVICILGKPSIESTVELFQHPRVALICVTGGPAVVKAAMKAGKRVIAAGPGNPPVVVDESADLDKAAEAIIEGASFDNNLLCIGEKEVFVVEAAADKFIAAMKRRGAVQLTGRQIEALTAAAFALDKPDGAGCAKAHVKPELIGRDPAVLARAAGLQAPPETKLLFGETAEDHPFVQEEQMMPFLPVVRIPDVERAMQAAARAEHGYRHTAIIHTGNAETAARMARVLNTTLFVQNASCAARLGLGGPGYLSYSIATPTGEGVTTPLTFTRQRQVTVAGSLRII